MRSRLIITLLVAVFAVACGSEESADTTLGEDTTTTTYVYPGNKSSTTTDPTATTHPPAARPNDDLPPHIAPTLFPEIQPLLEPLGFRMTRGVLIDMADLRPSEDGRHLAIYVAPMEELTPAEHADMFVPLTRAFLPLVFDLWGGLDSFDICQEPHEWLEGGVPPAKTLIDLDRATAATIDWDTVTLADLIALAETEPHLTVTASADVADSEPWRAAANP